MKKFVVTTALCSAMATSGLADQAKPKISEKDFEKQMVLSTQQSSSSAVVPIFIMLLLVMAAAAASGGGGGSAMHYVH